MPFRYKADHCIHYESEVEEKNAVKMYDETYILKSKKIKT